MLASRRAVLYRLAIGVLGGAGMGWALGQPLFGRRGCLTDRAPGILALASVLLTYAAVELIEGYGFIAVFVSGITCRRVERNHAFHRRLHTFSEALEEAVTAILLVMLGGALAALWREIDWQATFIGFALLLVIRPIAGWVALWRTPLNKPERAVVAFYGVRGVGSVYYLSYASGQMEFVIASQIWALVAFTIFASTLIHGATARFVVDRVVAIRSRER